jgi:hypothetical protein
VRAGILAQALAGAVVVLDPRAAPALRLPTRVELVEDLGRQHCLLAGGKDRPERLVDRRRRGLAQHRDVPDAGEVDAVGRELKLLPGIKDRVLGRAAGFPGRPLAAEAGDVMVAR